MLPAMSSLTLSGSNSCSRRVLINGRYRETENLNPLLTHTSITSEVNLNNLNDKLRLLKLKEGFVGPILLFI